MLKKYYQLTKPGMIYGNAVTAAAGFFLAAQRHVNWMLFLAMLLGLALIIGSACVFNNIWDRDIDCKMSRTKQRALVKGEIGERQAFLFGSVLLLAGIAALRLFTNSYTLVAAFAGFLTYVFMYTPLKRKTIHATLVGAVSGATPPVVGYAAVAGKYDMAALLLFVILFLWQMPHFYAIAMFRQADYQNASVPVMPIIAGTRSTKIQILLYTIVFTISLYFLYYHGFAGKLYLSIALLLGVAWIAMAVYGFIALNQKLWARKMFFLSLIVLMVWSVMLAVGPAVKR